MIDLAAFSKLRKDFDELKKQYQMLYNMITRRSLTDADKIRGITVVTDDPTDGQGLVFDVISNRYKPSFLAATATPTASKIPIADASGKLDGWLTKIAARYSTNAAQSIANASYVIVNFEDQTYDTHSAVTIGAAWKFTCPAGQAGTYRVAAMLLFTTTTTFTAGEVANLLIYKGGAFYSSIDRKTSESSTNMYIELKGSDDVYLADGEHIDIRVYQESGAALALHNDGLYNHVAISRI